MIKMEDLKDMMNSENAPVIAGIAGIVALVGIDRITKHNYKMDASKDSVSLAPAQTAKSEESQEQKQSQ